MNCSKDTIVSETIGWLERFVIGLNLCPFAKAIHVKKQIRYAVSDASTTTLLISHLREELLLLQATLPTLIESTLLIHPNVLQDFDDYNDFLSLCNLEIAALKLDGVIQIASFHPRYQFEGTEREDVTNYTNRSPYPTLHLLREESVSRAVDGFPMVDEIYKKNMETLRRLGESKIRKMIAESSSISTNEEAGYESID